MGVVVGTPSDRGAPISIAEADSMIFGYVLLNDWSARDFQVWEYQPLGPFQSKAFATTISPWVVTQEALEPFRVRHRSKCGNSSLHTRAGLSRGTQCSGSGVSNDARARQRPWISAVSARADSRAA